MPTEDEMRRRRYDTASVPWDAYATDPSLLLGVVKQLVTARGEVGDIVFFMVPQGTANETMHYLTRLLENRPASGLPGGPTIGGG